MTDREALLRAVCDSPDDDVPRLVFADWLEEHGEPERAEFIRVQCEAARSSDAPAMAERIDALLRSHQQKWLNELENPHKHKKGWAREIDWVETGAGWLDGPAFDRGFPTRLWVRTPSVLEKYPWLLSRVTPVRQLMIHNVRNAGKLMALAPLRHLLTFRARIITRAAVDGLTTCPYLRAVPDIRLPLNTLPAEYTDRLRQCFGERLQQQW